jgi:hypothetical protein
VKRDGTLRLLPEQSPETKPANFRKREAVEIRLDFLDHAQILFVDGHFQLVYFGLDVAAFNKNSVHWLTFEVAKIWLGLIFGRVCG